MDEAIRSGRDFGCAGFVWRFIGRICGDDRGVSSRENVFAADTLAMAHGEGDAGSLGVRSACVDAEVIAGGGCEVAFLIAESERGLRPENPAEKLKSAIVGNTSGNTCDVPAKPGVSRKPVALRHGHRTSGSASPTYESWRSMIQRCHNPKAAGFWDYGGRGIRVCRRWRGRGGFVLFLRDMGLRPPGMSLDRIDVDRGYTKANCRWATKTDQQRNRRCSRG